MPLVEQFYLESHVTTREWRFVLNKQRESKIVPSSSTQSCYFKNNKTGHFNNGTRFGPKRVAADMEGNGELGFWEIY